MTLRHGRSIYGVDEQTGFNLWSVVDPLAVALRRSRSYTIMLLVRYALSWTGPVSTEELARKLAQFEMDSIPASSRD